MFPAFMKKAIIFSAPLVSKMQSESNQTNYLYAQAKNFTSAKCL